jgi:hypothetical protein
MPTMMARFGAVGVLWALFSTRAFLPAFLNTTVVRASTALGTLITGVSQALLLESFSDLIADVGFKHLPVFELLQNLRSGLVSRNSI